jgi:GNAT superfamily N-acetyltransferase
MFPDLTIRSSTPSDEAAIVTLWRACNLVTSYNDPTHDFHFARGKQNSDVLVGSNAGRIVGSVMVGHDGHRGWMYYVASDPDNRKHGIGKQMVQAAEQWLKGRGILKVLLLIRETNTDVVSPGIRWSRAVSMVSSATRASHSASHTAARRAHTCGREVAGLAVRGRVRCLLQTYVASGAWRLLSARSPKMRSIANRARPLRADTGKAAGLSVHRASLREQCEFSVSPRLV